jgi:hypothetical protein
MALSAACGSRKQHGDWYATGTLEGDLLKVEYNDDMFYSDFEHAVYTRMP